MRRRFRIAHEELAAVEPSDAELVAHAAELAAAYNDGHNARMMGHDEPFTPEEVIEHFDWLREEGGHAFLLFRDAGVLSGDADLRDVVGGSAELALMIGARSAQGRGLGTRYARMLHAFAFRTLGLGRLIVAIRPENAASRRLFEKLAYRVDDSAAARAHAEADDEVVMSLAAADFVDDPAIVVSTVPRRKQL